MKEILTGLVFHIPLISLVAGAIGFFIGLRRYTASQKWLKLEFLAKEVDRFYKIPEVRNSLWMLDWQVRRIPLFPDALQVDERNVLVSDEIVRSALSDKSPGESYSEIEAAIRDNFDVLFVELARFHVHSKTGLFSFQDFYPYIAYWLQILKDGRGARTKDFVFCLRGFLLKYDYKEVLELLELCESSSERRVSCPLPID